jgi:hypothetical protein
MINKEQWQFTKRDNISTAWKGLEDYIFPIIKHFNIKQNITLEFGVDHGYSTDILSQAFDKVVGVDSFVGDVHINHAQGDGFCNTVKNSFAGTNVEIVRSSFEDFIKNNTNRYDLIHIDIVHEYEPTFNCTDWAIQHSDVVILHDTESFPEIKKVCQDISAKHHVGFYNITEHFGLGVLYKTVEK